MVSVWAAHADIAASLPAKHFGKDIVHSPEVGEASIARIGIGSGIGKIAIVPLPRALGPGCIDFAAIKTRALLRIAQKIISRRNRLELFLGLFVAGDLDLPEKTGGHCAHATPVPPLKRKSPARRRARQLRNRQAIVGPQEHQDNCRGLRGHRQPPRRPPPPAPRRAGPRSSKAHATT